MSRSMGLPPWRLDWTPCSTMHPKSGPDKRASRTLGDVVDLRPHPSHHPGMDRRRFVLTSLAGALAVPLGAEGHISS